MKMFSISATSTRLCTPFKTDTVLTWPDENVLHRQHGGQGEQQVLTAERRAFEHSPGKAWLQGELQHQLPQLGHFTSPTADTPER